MDFHEFGDPADPNLVFVLGWGNRVDHPTVAWFVERLADAGYHVHAAEIPDNGTDFERDYLGPLRDYLAGLDSFRLLSHSTGGLVAAHLPVEGAQVFLSPFWGLNRQGLAGVLTPLLARLPTDRQFLGSDADAAVLGELKDPDVAAAGPDASPAWIATMQAAQATLPEFRDGSVVFCSLRDEVVSVRAIGERAPASAVELYEGGHELFASASRDEAADRVLAALDSTPPLSLGGS